MATGVNTRRQNTAHGFALIVCIGLFLAHLLFSSAIPAPNGFVGFVIFYCVLYPIGYVVALLTVPTGVTAPPPPPQKLSEEFCEGLGSRSDAELYAMLHDMTARSSDYVPGALDAVKTELARRNLDPLSQA